MERTWKPAKTGILTIIAGCQGIGAEATLATVVSLPLGILSIIFVSMGKKEFVNISNKEHLA